MNVAFHHPANAGILRHLSRHWDSTKTENRSAPSSVYDLHTNALGTHPDLAEHLWRFLPEKLPVNCGWVVYGYPVLIRRDTGIIFGFAGGTHTYALRLPEELRGSRPVLTEIGAEWIRGEWQERETDWCLAAYEYAGLSPSP